MSDAVKNVPGDNLTQAERESVLDSGRYLVIGGRIIAHKDALPKEEPAPVGTQLSGDEDMLNRHKRPD